MFTPLTSKNGCLAGATSATRCPTVQASWVKFQGASGNSGSVYFGQQGVTVPNGSTTTTGGFECAAGADTGWLKCNNVDEFYYISDGSGDAGGYITLP